MKVMGLTVMTAVLALSAPGWANELSPVPVREVESSFADAQQGPLRAKLTAPNGNLQELLLVCGSHAIKLNFQVRNFDWSVLSTAIEMLDDRSCDGEVSLYIYFRSRSAYELNLEIKALRVDFVDGQYSSYVQDGDYGLPLPIVPESQ